MAADAPQRSPTDSDRSLKHSKSSFHSSTITFVDGDYEDKLNDDLSAKSSEEEPSSIHVAHDQADKFVHEKGPELHPIFSHLTPCEDQKAEKRPQRPDHGKSAPTEHFYRVIEMYRNQAKEVPFLNDFDIRKVHTWEEVFRAADLAHEKCKRDERRSVLRKLGRVAQRSAPAMSPWLELIPNGNYTSALYGGLKIVFNVASRIAEQRVRIIETFGQIPETIRRAEDRLKEWPDDKVLYDAADELYLAVLKSVEAMIEWLVGKSSWRKIGSVLAKPQSNTPTDLGFEEVKRALEKLGSRAITLQGMAIARTDSNTRSIRNEVNAINISTHTSEKMANEIYSVMTNTHDDIQTIIMMMAKEAHDGTVPFLIDQLKNSETQKIAQERRHKREIWSLRKENEALKLKEEAERAYRIRQLDILQTMRSTLTRDQLADLLGIYPDMIEQDLKRVVKEGQKSAPSTQSRGYWLLHNTKFQAWLTKFAAKTLMVNGNANAAQKISAMSYACALIIRSLARVEAVHTISFFCGLHTSQKDPLSGPTGLLKTLISQLLKLQKFDLTFIDSLYEQGLRDLEFAYLKDLFRRLIKELPDDLTIFCIVDGISFHEKPRNAEETEDATRMLYDIAEDPESSPIFKLLILGPVMSRSAKACFPSTNRLIVPTDAGNGQPLTFKQTQRRTSGHISNQERRVKSGSTLESSESAEEDSDETKVAFSDLSISADELLSEDEEQDLED